MQILKLALACLLLSALAACGGPLLPGAPQLDPGATPPIAAPPDGGATADVGTPIDGGGPDGGALDGGAADAGSPDAGAPDAGAPDAGAPDAGAPDAGAPDAGVTPPGPRVGDCQIYPPDNAFNRDISGDAVDPRSPELMAALGSGSLYVHPDFGAPQYGLPYVVVPATQSRVRMSFTYANQSDPGPYPFPADLPIQGGPNGGGDRHAIVLEQGTCRLYETWGTYPAGGGFNAGSGALFDLSSNALRPEGWTSATASGLPMLPGLARPEEVLDQGELRHALVFTGGATAHSYVHPATHSSGTSSDANAPPMGTRVRLRKDFDLSPYHGASLVILRGLRRYGMFVVDNAPAIFWSVAGAQSARWPDADLQQLKGVPVSAFEVVQLGEIHQGQ